MCCCPHAPRVGPSKCPRILIKRDDLTGLGLGGNKARKLEYLIADALAKGAHTVITTGAVQSNHARMTAAAACIAGLRCVLVLTSRHAVPPIEGNLLLDRLFGREPVTTRTMAVLHYVDGLTYEEVARETRLSVSGVRKRLRRLRQRMKEMLDDRRA